MSERDPTLPPKWKPKTPEFIRKRMAVAAAGWHEKIAARGLSTAWWNRPHPYLRALMLALMRVIGVVSLLTVTFSMGYLSNYDGPVWDDAIQAAYRLLLDGFSWLTEVLHVSTPGT